MTDEGLFYTEVFTEDYVRKFKVEKIFFEGRTKYQYVQCFSNALFGKVLFLDRKIQSAQVDEYVYHESLVHPAMMTHPKPQRILVLGGGEGATLREVYRHSTVESITMVDIDEELVGICENTFQNGLMEPMRIHELVLLSEMRVSSLKRLKTNLMSLSQI